MRVIDLTEVNEEEYNTIMYCSPPLGDRFVFENKHHPMCNSERIPAGCLHWSHQPWMGVDPVVPRKRLRNCNEEHDRALWALRSAARP